MTTSLELSKRLWELKPEWNDTHAFYNGGELQFNGEAGWEGAVYQADYSIKNWSDDKLREAIEDIPAYSLDYLLTKLEEVSFIGQIRLVRGKANWQCELVRTGEKTLWRYADNPTDATAKLCTELIEEGLL